jgi:hypothetical protein
MIASHAKCTVEETAPYAAKGEVTSMRCRVLVVLAIGSGLWTCSGNAPSDASAEPPETVARGLGRIRQIVTRPSFAADPDRAEFLGLFERASLLLEARR